MRIAITNNNERLSPVFDVASQILIIDFESNENKCSKSCSVLNYDAIGKINFLYENGVSILICGAISRQIQDHAESLGMQVYSFITGNTNEVFQAWRDGHLDKKNAFFMPGCGFRRGKCRNRNKGNTWRWCDNNNSFN